VVLKVRLLAVDVEVEVVSGASVDTPSEVEVGKLAGVVLEVENEWELRRLFPMFAMIFADLVGRQSASSRVMNGKSALSTAWKEMCTRSR
jgi:hypothetical protein